MKYTATIRANVDNIFEEFRNDRSNVAIEETDEGVLFDIEAEDPVALRASLNSITKQLAVYEKMSGLKNGKD